MFVIMRTLYFLPHFPTCPTPDFETPCGHTSGRGDWVLLSTQLVVGQVLLPPLVSS